MNEHTRKQIGVLIMASCAIGFFASFIYFFGSSTGNIEYTNLNYMLKLACTFGFAVFGLFFGLLFYGGRKIAFQLGGGMSVLLVLSLLIGFLLHHS